MDLLEGVAVSVTEPDAAGRDRDLQLLLLSPHQDEGVVYLMTRKKYKQPKARVLALHTRNKTLLGASEFGTEKPTLSTCHVMLYAFYLVASFGSPDLCLVPLPTI